MGTDDWDGPLPPKRIQVLIVGGPHDNTWAEVGQFDAFVRVIDEDDKSWVRASPDQVFCRIKALPIKELADADGKHVRYEAHWDERQ